MLNANRTARLLRDLVFERNRAERDSNPRATWEDKWDDGYAAGRLEAYNQAIKWVHALIREGCNDA